MGKKRKRSCKTMLAVVLALAAAALSAAYPVRGRAEADTQGILNVSDMGSFPEESGIPAIPAESRYELADTALGLTREPAYATAAAAAKYFRLTPALCQTSFDLAEYEYVYLWIYVTKTDLHNGDSIELCSGGAQDKKENAVRFNNWNLPALQAGWNECLVPISSFTYATGGGWDLSAINFIGIVLRSAQDVQTGAVSRIYAVKESQVTDLDEDISQEEGNGKLGRGDLIHDFEAASAASGQEGLTLSANLPEAVQPAYYNYICAEIYVENKARLSKKEAVLTISSSQEEGVQELSCDLTQQTIGEGWNTVFLPLEDFRISGYDYDETGYNGVCDLLKICRVGIRWAVRDSSTAAEPVLKLGRVTMTNSLVTKERPAGKYLLKEDAMAVTTGEYSVTVSGGSTQKLARLMPEIAYGEGDSVDISGKQYLYFWLYVSNAAADDSTVSDNELELTSGGKCDEEENAIRLYRISEEGEPWLMSGDYGTFKTGWNEYAVPIRDLTRLTNKSGEKGVGCDLTALNYLRIYFHTKAGIEPEQVTYAVSTVYAINPEDLSEEGVSLPDLGSSDDDPTKDPSQNFGSDPSKDPSGENGQQEQGTVKTGDTEEIGIYCAISMLALALLTFMAVLRRRMKRNAVGTWKLK